MPLTKPIKYLDMFAGIGGFRSGLSQFGDFFIPVGFCEIDPYTKKAYEAIYDTKGELYFHDARDIIPEDLPDIDLICGGFPCQSFSIAGKRGGFEDARGTLFFEIARIARVKRPSYLLLENVPGLLSHDKGRTFATILTALDELGYHVSWQVLNSADFGVPQSRKRVFLVCYLGDECPGEVLSFTEANPKTIIQKVKGRQGDRIYDTDGLSCTLTSGAGGFAGNTGLYDTGEILIKSFTKSGFQIAEPGDSIDLAYPNLNSRRGRVGKQIAHTITPNITQGVYCLDMNPDPKITELARCITARQDSGIGNRKGEHSGVLEVGPRAIISPERETVRQQGRRIKDPNEPIPDFECGEIDDIENWITIEEYKELAEDEKKYYAYYEWNNRWDDYEYKSILISKIDFLSDLFRDGDSVEGKCGWIDLSDSDVRLIVEQS